MRNDNSVESVLNLIVKKLKIPATRESIEAGLQKHPDPSSLVAISDLLDHWLVPNVAYNVSVKEMQEAEIPLPFIACFKDGEFAMVSQIDQANVIVSNNRWNNHRLDLVEFKKYYRGTILAFEKNPSSGETDYTLKRRREIVKNLRIPFVISGLLLVLVLFLSINQNHLFALANINVGLLFLVKSIGVLISILLLMQSLDANNPILKKICGGDENHNCNAILASKAAKITEELSWSEVGFFYFGGTWLTLLMNNNNPSLLKVLAVVNLMSLPYTFYSVYYQWRIAKQWCVFCCSIQALLWLEFFSFLPSFLANTQKINLYDCSKLFIDMLIPIILWVYLKPLLINSEKLKLLIPELYRFKYNKDFFKNIIQNEPRYQLPTEENSITIGNREAGNTITVVSSPFCHACAETHKALDDLTVIRNDIKLQFIFLTRIRYKELDTKVLTHFMRLKSTYDDFGIKQALSNWYLQKNKNYESWQGNHPVDEFANDSEAILNQKEWCKMAGIAGTPTLFINGRKLPNPYRPEDIQYII